MTAGNLCMWVLLPITLWLNSHFQWTGIHRKEKEGDWYIYLQYTALQTNRAYKNTKKNSNSFKLDKSNAVSVGTTVIKPYLSICLVDLRPWQTRTHCCGHIVADTNVSLFARVRNICCGHKFCVRNSKNVFDFVPKHFMSATNVSQFAQPKKHHEQQYVRNNVSSFARAFSLVCKVLW